MDFVKTTVNRRPRIMKAGDLVIVYERHDQLDHVYLKPGKVYDNRFGNFHHDDIIGKPFGSKIQSRSTQGFIYVLEPTPELWSIAVHVSFPSVGYTRIHTLSLTHIHTHTIYE